MRCTAIATHLGRTAAGRVPEKEQHRPCEALMAEDEDVICADSGFHRDHRILEPLRDGAAYSSLGFVAGPAGASNWASAGFAREF